MTNEQIRHSKMGDEVSRAWWLETMKRFKSTCTFSLTVTSLTQIKAEEVD